MIIEVFEGSQSHTVLDMSSVAAIAVKNRNFEFVLNNGATVVASFPDALVFSASKKFRDAASEQIREMQSIGRCSNVEAIKVREEAEKAADEALEEISKCEVERVLAAFKRSRQAR